VKEEKSYTIVIHKELNLKKILIPDKSLTWSLRNLEVETWSLKFISVAYIFFKKKQQHWTQLVLKKR